MAYVARTLLVLDEVYDHDHVDSLLGEGKVWDAVKKRAAPFVVGAALSAGAVGIPGAKYHGDTRRQVQQSREQSSQMAKRAQRSASDRDVIDRLDRQDDEASQRRAQGRRPSEPARKGWGRGVPSK